MAGLISTGIWGFICSATMKAGKITATFISGATGWIIKNNGDAEFKSIYARDKFITNEYVYNRIRVTEDEEIISSSIKIASAIDNQDGTWTIYPDLREGDVNPLATGDLLQGYYHAPGNTGFIYAVQRFTAIDDPNMEDQSIIVTCEEDSTPYLHMIIVRVGNESNTDLQSFIIISSRTNCQYFYDEITSFADLDNPDKIKCAIGKADPGLIPEWATSAVGAVRRWFGLIADGVILRGIFILKSSGKTVESELEGIGETITEVETRFEVKEGQISSKVTETKKYAEIAYASAASASDSAGAAKDAKNISIQKASEVTQTAEGFQSTVTEVTTKAVTDSVTGATELIEEKVGTAVTQSAKEWKVEVMGVDKDGNPNKILAAINASEEGIKIEGDKVEITGTLLAEIIKATGLNINDKFVIEENGDTRIHGSLSLPYKYVVLKPSVANMLSKDSGFYLYASPAYELNNYDFRITLPAPSPEYNGVEFNIYSPFMITRSGTDRFDLAIEGGSAFYYPGYIPSIGSPFKFNKIVVISKEVRVRCIYLDSLIAFWYLDNYKDFDREDLIMVE